MIGGLHTCSFNDFPGHLAAVVFTRGCNLRCRYCHNPSLCRVSGHATHTIDDVASLLRVRSGKLTGVVISGGEPALHTGLSELLRMARDLGFSTKLDTNGTRPERIAELVAEGWLDYLAVDVKVAPSTSSSWLCGEEGQAELALETLRIAVNASVPCEARTTVLRGIHNERELDSAARAIAAVGVGVWRLQPVHTSRVLDPTTPFHAPSRNVLAEAVKVAATLGLDAVVRGD